MLSNPRGPDEWDEICPQRLRSRSALITGAGGDIGTAIAVRLAELSYRLIIVGRQRAPLERAAEQIAQSAPEVDIAIRPCDVADYASVSTLFGELAGTACHLHVLVNGAGIAHGGVTAELDPQRWLEVVGSNLNATFYVTREALARELLAAGARIVNIAAAGEQAAMIGAAYAAAKSGIVGFTRALGLELAGMRRGITVNAVCPGFVETAMAETLRDEHARLRNLAPEEARVQLEAKVPIGRYIEPAEVAELVAYLVSPRAAAVTAQAFPISGGLI